VRTIRNVTEAEVLDCFWRAELAASSRWTDAEVDERKRTWRERIGLFHGFPRDVDWERVALTADEVLGILYIDWDWWLRLSGGTRRPLDAARRIRAGHVPGVTADEHEPIARGAATHARPIAVTDPEHSRLVCLEGHVRLTAYALYPEHLPAELEIFLGTAPDMAGWSEF
jgi:hypothetical protein